MIVWFGWFILLACRPIWFALAIACSGRQQQQHVPSGANELVTHITCHWPGVTLWETIIEVFALHEEARGMHGLNQ